MTPDAPATIGSDAETDGDRPTLVLRVFGSKEFFRLWLAQVVSAMGDWLGFLAIAVLAARVGQNPSAAVAFVMSARIIPGFFLAPVAGVLADRWDRKRQLVVCDVGRAGVLMTLPFVDTVSGLVLASLVLEVFTLLWQPAKEASVPNLVPQDHLTTANSLSLLAAYGTFPIASALFAVLAAIGAELSDVDVLSAFNVSQQESLAFYVDVATFLISALIISTIHLPSRPRSEVQSARGRHLDFGETFHEMKEGWQYIFINPTVRAVNIGLAMALIGGGMLVPLGPVFSAEVLGAGQAGFGLFITSLGFGVAAGVLVLSVFQKRLPKARVFTIALFVAGGTLFMAASVSSLGLAVILVFAIGLCAGAVYVLGFTLLHENVGDDLRGRTFGGLYTLVRLCVLIAFFVGPVLAAFLGQISESQLDSHIELFGARIYIPGVRLTLWLAALIILAAALLTAHSVRAGERAASGHPSRKTREDP